MNVKTLAAGVILVLLAYYLPDIDPWLKQWLRVPGAILIVIGVLSTEDRS